MATRYREAPLVEAVFEFAPQQATISPEARASLADELRPRYGGRSDEFRLSGFTLELSKAGQSAAPLRAPARKRMWASDERTLVQFADDLCAFNALAPYTHYVDYLPAIEDLFARYSAHAQPDGTKFLGHRYINRVRLPPEGRPQEYFAVYPDIPAEIPAPPHPPFAMNLQTETLSSGQVMMSLALQRVEAGRPTYLLDLYARTAEDLP